MHVLVFTNHFYPENFRINDLVFWLVEHGHEVTVVTGLPNYPGGKIFKGYGVFKRRSEVVQGARVHRIPLIPRGKGRPLNLLLNYTSSLVMMCLLTPILCRKKYDATFVFETSPVSIGMPAILIKWLRRTPIVFWVLDLWPESLSATGAIKNSFVLGLIRRFVRFIYSNCDRIMVSSRGFVESIRTIGGYGGEIKYFPNWVERQDFPSSEPEQTPELPEGFRIVFTGNIGAAQDFGTILDAAEMLKEHTDIHWVIVGSGRQAEWVKSEVANRGLQDCFHLFGRFPPETMPYFLQSAGALLLPLRNEQIFSLTAPGKLQPYLASGKPIIASINGEGADIVNQAQAGIACGAEQPEKLKDAVLKLHGMSEAERKKLGGNGKRFVEQHFNREVLMNQFEHILKEVAKKA